MSRGNGHAREVSRYLADIGASSATAEDLVVALTRRAAGDTLEVDGLQLDASLLESIPELLAFENRILPLHRARGILFVAVPAGMDPEPGLGEVARRLGVAVEPIPVSEIDVGGVIVKAHQLMRRRGRGAPPAAVEPDPAAPPGGAALPELGMPPAILARVREVLSDPQGLLLVTGPARSGKSTTVRAIVEDWRRRGLRVSTADAVQGLAALEDLLLGDPDALAIDGLESPSVAARAIRAASEGRRLVVAIEAPDAAAAAARLAEMKVDAHLVATALRGGLNQRMLRKLCPGCRDDYKEDPAMLEDLRLDALLRGIPLKRGRGCGECGGTGFRDGVVVFEFGSRAADGSLRYGFQPLVADALAKVLSGQTALKELVDQVPFTQILQAADRLNVRRVETGRYAKP